jgi:hemerythrin-like metal-binding protein
MSIEWKNGYRIGDADIDTQHEELFRRAANVAVADSLEGQMSWALSLYEYTKTHFAHEENLMGRINYPDLEKHKKQHRGLISMLHKVATEINDGRSNKAALEEFMNYWLLTHIATFDTKLAESDQFKHSVFV